MKQIRDTSTTVAYTLINEADILPGQKILEPSAGNGKIISCLLDVYPDYKLEIDAVELNTEKYLDLTQISGIKAFHKDFLYWWSGGEKKYDRIIACPPFNNNVDLEHIQHMYDMLGEGGALTSLTTPYWLTNNEPHQVEFRKWLEDKNYYLKMLPDNSFIERGRTVPTAIIKIYRNH